MDDWPQLKKILEFYKEAFITLDEKRRTPLIIISYYPYVGINHTIRVRDGMLFVRISELCREMSMHCHRSLAYVLISKLLGKQIPKAHRDVYLSYAKSAEMLSKAIENKRKRGKMVITDSKGTYYDLNEIFDDLNTKFFGGNLEKPILTWSAKRTYRMLGRHDATHGTITLSRSLDALETPRFVIEYIMYHEMLHIHHPAVHHNGRRYHHTAAFRRDESRFPQYFEAEEWIDLNTHKFRRTAGRG